MIARRLNGQGNATASHDLFGRASAFLHRALELTADSVRQVEGGWAVVTPSLPQVWSLNQIRLVRPVTPDTALELADEHLASVSYRHIAADNELGRVLERPLRSTAFAVEHEVVMAIADGPNQAAPRSPAPHIIEADEQAVLPLERRWLQEDERVMTADGITQLIEAGLREGRALGERRFGIADGKGKLAAMTKLRTDTRIAQVEDVYTVPEARGQGFARALVAHAVRVAQRAGNDMVFIVADDNDWPKHLYARLGFRPVGLRWAFHRDLTGPSGAGP